MADDIRRIVCFGATGFTGELVVRALVRRGARPVLAGRHRERLAKLAADCGGLDLVVADASNGSIRALVGADDVLLSTVGPFLRYGWPAVSAACAAGATYLDSTGEPPFIRRVLTELSSRATATGASLVPAFGYDFVPGNLAGALALRNAPEATGVRIGYFVRGRAGGVSGGTAASAAGVLLEPGYAWRDGALHEERRPAAQLHTFQAANRQRQAVTIAGSEHLFLPQLHPGLRNVDVYLGWAGRYSPLVQVASPLAAGLLRVPGAATVVGQLVKRLVPRSTGGPDAQRRAATRSLAVAEALDSAGTVLARTILTGPSPYDLTAELLAWGALQAAGGRLAAPGVLGPVQAFGLESLEQAAANIGLQRAS